MTTRGKLVSYTLLLVVVFVASLAVGAWLGPDGDNSSPTHVEHTR
jgi:hypothetical protein